MYIMKSLDMKANAVQIAREILIVKCGERAE
jgi:hypothetical protein